MKPIFHARAKNGQLIISNRRAFDSYVASLNGECSVEIRQWTNRRSLDQNALMWIHYTIIANDTGHTPDEIHELAKRHCLDPQFIKWKGKMIKIAGSTTKLSKSELGEYLDRVAVWSGVPIPSLEVR